MSQYKTATAKPANTTTQTKEDLVDRVKNAISVPSNRQEPAVIKTQEPISEQAAFDALAKDYEKTFGFRR